MSEKLKGWRDLPQGGVMVKPGKSADYDTGDWRTERPIWDEEICIHCLLCWIYCPDTAVFVEDGKMTGFDYDHCKGCGICEYECPKEGAIIMRPESEFRGK